MNRCKDYACFVVWFAGLSYCGLWVTTLHPRADGIAASLPPGLHILGALAAVFVSAQLALFGVKRYRSKRSATPAAEPEPRAKPAQPLRWKAPPGANTVKPRSQFGLRARS